MSPKAPYSHDNFFKDLMRDPQNLRDFIRGFLPTAISANIDLDTIDYKDREQTTKRKRKFHLDLALTCKLKDQDAEIYLVFEHKSSPEKITLVQILTYCTAVWEHNILIEKRDPVPIIPSVFYHGKGRFKLPRQFSDYFTVPDDLKEYMVDFRYALFDASTLNEHQISQKSYNNLYLAAALLAMQGVFRDLPELTPALQSMLKLPDGRRIMILEYLLENKDDDPDTFIEMVNQLGGDDMSSIAQQLRQEGRQEGRREGRREEACATLRAQMKRKFQQIPELVDKRIDRASHAELQKYLENILDAGSPEETIGITTS